MTIEQKYCALSECPKCDKVDMCVIRGLLSVEIDNYEKRLEERNASTEAVKIGSLTHHEALSAKTLNDHAMLIKELKERIDQNDEEINIILEKQSTEIRDLEKVVEIFKDIEDANYQILKLQQKDIENLKEKVDVMGRAYARLSAQEMKKAEIN